LAAKTEPTAKTDSTEISDSSKATAVSDTVGRSLAAIADEALPPLPSPPASVSRPPDQDVAFALRLLGRDSAVTSDAASKISQAAPGALAPPPPISSASQATNGKPVTPSAPALSASTPKGTAMVDAAPLIPTGKDIAASGPRVSNRDSSPISQISTAKSQNASQSSDSPKVTPRQPLQDESSKGSSTSGGNTRDTASGTSLKTVEAKYSNAPFTEVHEAVSTAAPEPSPNAQPKTLNTNLDSLVPLKVNEAPAPAAANDISLRLSGPDQTSATVRVLDRAGEIHVSVRASDPQLATTLRSDVDQLRSHLTTRGWDAEVWKPDGTPALKEASNHANSGSQEHASSAFKRDSQGQSQSRQQQNSPGKRPAWLDQLEESVHQGGSRP
jgi:hypothetical protein